MILVSKALIFRFRGPQAVLVSPKANPAVQEQTESVLEDADAGRPASYLVPKRCGCAADEKIGAYGELMRSEVGFEGHGVEKTLCVE